MGKLKSSVAVACFLPGRSKDLSAPQYVVLPYQRSVYEYGQEHYLSRLRSFVVLRGYSL